MKHVFIETGKEKSNEHFFIKTLIERKCGKVYDIDFDIVNVGGYTNLYSQGILNQFRNHESSDECDIVIFDSDYASTGGGFLERKEFIEKKLGDHDLNFSLFLFPNNHDDGIFETLLRRIVKPDFEPMIQYFQEYEEKVEQFNQEIKERQSLREDVFETPDEKARIYSYISSFKRSQSEKKNFKDGNWDFANEKYWNLQSEALVPIVDFLRNNFVK